MRLADAINIHAASESAFRGRKPGSIKSRNPDHVMKKAREIWGDHPDFDLELSREIRSECPHMKAMTYDKMSATQKRNVAGRMHSKAQTRMRAARLKSKKVKVNASAEILCAQCEIAGGGPGSGCKGENCGRPKGSGSGKAKNAPVHKEVHDVAIKLGYKQYAPGAYSHDEGESTIDVDKHGNWTHEDHGASKETVKTGKGAQSLEKHVIRYHKKIGVGLGDKPTFTADKQEKAHNSLTKAGWKYNDNFSDESKNYYEKGEHTIIVDKNTNTGNWEHITPSDRVAHSGPNAASLSKFLKTRK